MSLQALQVVVVEGLDRGVLDRAVHPFGLAVGPRMVRLGQSVLDAIGVADAVEGVGTEQPGGGPISVLGQVGEGHIVVGQHDVDLVGKDFHHGFEEG
jgi:hypothetical protein